MNEALLKIIRYPLLYLIYINQNYNPIKETQTTGRVTHRWLGVTKFVYCNAFSHWVSHNFYVISSRFMRYNLIILLLIKTQGQGCWSFVLNSSFCNPPWLSLKPLSIYGNVGPKLVNFRIFLYTLHLLPF